MKVCGLCAALVAAEQGERGSALGGEDTVAPSDPSVVDHLLIPFHPYFFLPGIPTAESILYHLTSILPV